jgi:hypothetical protein
VRARDDDVATKRRNEDERNATKLIAAMKRFLLFGFIESTSQQ